MVNHITYTTEDGKELLFIEVPQDAFDFEIKTCDKLFSSDSVLTYKTLARWEQFKKANWDWKTRSKEPLKIIGQTSDARSQVWKDVALDPNTRYCLLEKLK